MIAVSETYLSCPLSAETTRRFADLRVFPRQKPTPVFLNRQKSARSVWSTACLRVHGAGAPTQPTSFFLTYDQTSTVMKAAATATHTDARAKNSSPAPDAVAHGSFDSQISPVTYALLQRSPACACGGGCPRCEQESAKQKVQ